MLEAEESLGALAAALGKRLIEDGNDKGANCDFKQTHQEHRKSCQRERFPVRFNVSKQSLKIAHRQLQIVDGQVLKHRQVNSESVARMEGLETAVKLKKNYTYPRVITSRMRDLRIARTVG
jgi:hypothetical protein